MHSKKKQHRETFFTLGLIALVQAVGIFFLLLFLTGQSTEVLEARGTAGTIMFLFSVIYSVLVYRNS